VQRAGVSADISVHARMSRTAAALIYAIVTLPMAFDTDGGSSAAAAAGGVQELWVSLTGEADTGSAGSSTPWPLLLCWLVRACAAGSPTPLPAGRPHWAAWP
jgi:hypothetical protein